MAESDARVEKFINNLGFPARRGEKSEEHIGRVTRLFVQIADNLRPKMDQIILPPGTSTIEMTSLFSAPLILS